MLKVHASRRIVIQENTGKFGRMSRLSGPELGRVFSEGEKHVHRDLIAWSYRRRRTSIPRARLGISVSRKLGTAVRRNRIKRLLRESFRLNRHRISCDIDLAVYPRPGCRWRERKDAEESLLDLCRKAGIIEHA